VIIGIPKEIKKNEYRVPITPPGVEALVSKVHEVVIETNPGSGSGISDEAYKEAGGNTVAGLNDVYERGEMILKVKEIFPAEYDLLRECQIIFT